MNIKADIPTLIEEIDYGTPASKAEKQVTLTVDGREITVPEGTSIMRASMEAGVEIPKLCATDMLDCSAPAASAWSRLRPQRHPASCTTPVGGAWSSHAERPAGRHPTRRHGPVSDHPAGWNEKAGTGASEFDQVARSVGLTGNRYGVGGRNRQPDEGVAPGHGSLASTISPATRAALFRLRPGAVHRLLALRACREEVQGTFRADVGGAARIAHGRRQARDFIASECVSCGACVQACPTDALREKSILEKGLPDRSVVTTCAYCGVGCSFKAEIKNDEIVRMMPFKGGMANHGHSCVKGRFAYGYATHKDRILNPMIREKISDPWREVSWEQAFAHIASEFRLQYQYGRGAVGGITSSRCTNGETYLVRNWCGRVLATTMSTPAPASAIRRPATVSGRPMAPRPARRISIPSTRRTSSW